MPPGIGYGGTGLGGRERGFATTKDNPINPIGRSNDSNGVLEMLKQLMGLKGAPTDKLADLIAAIQGGFGSANIVRTPNVATASAQANNPFTYGRDATGPTKGLVVPAGPAGAFAITPSGNTLDVGRALNQKDSRSGLPEQAAPDMQLAETIKNFRARRRMMDKVRRFYA